MLPITQFSKNQSSATAVPDLQYTLKGIQDKDQDEVLCALRKLAELALRELEIFRRKIFMNLDSDIFLYLEKSTKIIN